jgi:hypothetical protein
MPEYAPIGDLQNLNSQEIEEACSKCELKRFCKPQMTIVSNPEKKKTLLVLGECTDQQGCKLPLVINQIPGAYV